MYEIFELLLAEKKMTPYRIHKLTGISTATLSDWKKGRSTPKIDKLEKIAECLGVTVDYLRTGKDSSDDQSDATLDFLSAENNSDDSSTKKAAAKLAKALEERDDLKRLIEYAKTLDPDKVDKIFQMLKLMSE